MHTFYSRITRGVHQLGPRGGRGVVEAERERGKEKKREMESKGTSEEAQDGLEGGQRKEGMQRYWCVVISSHLGKKDANSFRTLSSEVVTHDYCY